MQPTSNPLAQLRDIHLPDSVSWWPPAPGWWLLLCGVALLIAAAWWLMRRHQRGRWQRDALVQLQQELEQLRLDYQHSNDGTATCATLSALMRRVAIARFPASSVAGTHGEAWLKFLDAQALIPQQFSQSEWGEMLLNAPFSAAKVDPLPLIDHCQQWMEAAIKQKEERSQ
ncbi:MAG: DUF4381 domain-containing protein [Mariprofundales bacterium]